MAHGRFFAFAAGVAAGIALAVGLRTEKGQVIKEDLKDLGKDLLKKEEADETDEEDL